MLQIIRIAKPLNLQGTFNNNALREPRIVLAPTSDSL